MHKICYVCTYDLKIYYEVIIRFATYINKIIPPESQINLL